MVELETRLAFQEDLIQTLNQILAGQQERLQEVEREIGELRRQLRSLSSQQVANPFEESPPPHY